MKVVAIIQARMGSTRLPGKVLKDICGRTLLERVLQRVRSAASVEEVVVASSLEPADDAISRLCESCQVACFRGSESDVLDRYYHAAHMFGADAVVRVTSDCPLLDPAILDAVVDEFRRNTPDYACNDVEHGYPRGLDVEVIGIGALERSWREAREPYLRSHVTPYIYGNPSLFRCITLGCEKDFSAYRWTVDTSDDLDFVRAVYARLLPREVFGWRDLLALLQQQPELSDINAGIRQKSLVEG